MPAARLRGPEDRPDDENDSGMLGAKLRGSEPHPVRISTNIDIWIGLGSALVRMMARMVNEGHALNKFLSDFIRGYRLSKLSLG